MFSNETQDELDVLSLFSSDTMQEGIKVHGNANPKLISATKRLHAKGLLTQIDGGYLTPLGIEAHELALKLNAILS
ncbi:MAG: TIGR02647 family protein [Gammaproteobacteria bacterium]|nr:MAG: TIGR02647 family protein [Gammaproteobacteria bacterium]